MSAIYTVFKCNSKTNDEKVGPLHWSDDGIKTLCGKDIDENWYILDNTFTGDATCKKCVKVDEKIPLRNMRLN